MIYIHIIIIGFIPLALNLVQFYINYWCILRDIYMFKPPNRCFTLCLPCFIGILHYTQCDNDIG